MPEVTEVHKAVQNIAIQSMLITLGIHLISSHKKTYFFVLNLHFRGICICEITHSHLSYISVFIVEKKNCSLRPHFTQSIGRKIKAMAAHIWGLDFFVNWCLLKLFFFSFKYY